MSRLTVYIGRFSPLHNGHIETLTRALKVSDKVLIIIGSAKQPRTIKNPWFAEERAEIIQRWFDHYRKTHNVRQDALVIRTQRDHPYNNQRWLAEVQLTVNSVKSPADEIYITGSDRDSTTFYLKEFPTYKQDLVEEHESISRALSATWIRDIYFGQAINGLKLPVKEIDRVNSNYLPSTTIEYINEFRKTSAYDLLVEEYEFQKRHDEMYKLAPYTPTFNTVDSVVILAGHVLLVRRRNTPGRGLWAIPGGYLNPREWMVDGAIRELREETKLAVPEPVLRGSLKGDKVFDDPGRSLRGRIVTRAFLFRLPEHVIDGKIQLPKVKGSDDAEKAKWFQLSEAFEMSDRLFEDHHAIIETMTSIF